ncbi:hypothetical protein GCM10010168_04350 [Actinoplanes ianthinogenes]|uniref:Uncharacterized protein n=1 Tax=Actinoplanes ianthinogenes TaxID=122358 RepID=A0ABM7LU58_9ACTN|nr:hypothetical protein Aiant_34820 [Actinoplanes ianthinogenes]GGQ91960.1 hypothetical protein GCM10010168_04350 [Actinoplanes ianthinogenes]
MRRKEAITLVAAVTAGVVAAGSGLTAWAGWMLGAASARGAIEGGTLPVVPRPAVRQDRGHPVITWDPVRFRSGAPVGGYRVEETDGAPQEVGGTRQEADGNRQGAGVTRQETGEADGMRQETGEAHGGRQETGLAGGGRRIVCDVPAGTLSCVDTAAGRGRRSYVVRARAGTRWLGPASAAAIFVPKNEDRARGAETAVTSGGSRGTAPRAAAEPEAAETEPPAPTRTPATSPPAPSVSAPAPSVSTVAVDSASTQPTVAAG